MPLFTNVKSAFNAECQMPNAELRIQNATLYSFFHWALGM